VNLPSDVRLVGSPAGGVWAIRKGKLLRFAAERGIIYSEKEQNNNKSSGES